MTVLPGSVITTARQRVRRRRRHQALGGLVVAGVSLATLASGSSPVRSAATEDPTVRAGTIVHCDGDHFDLIDQRTARCVAATPTTTPPVPNPPPSTPPPPIPAPVPGPGCGGGIPLVGDQKALTLDIPTGTTIDARNALWRSKDVGDYAVNLLGTGTGTCWLGGTIVGEWPMNDSWDLWHHRSGLRWSEPKMTVQDVVIANEGDSLKPKDANGGQATDWTVRHVHVIASHDDCLENDYVHSGVIEN
ncbi:MAG: hypothetical protein ABJC79_04185, partial [Acidimicrobiia bacterium]